MWIGTDVHMRASRSLSEVKVVRRIESGRRLRPQADIDPDPNRAFGKQRGGRRRKMYKGAGESWNSPSTFLCPVSLSTLRSFSVSLSLPSTLFLAMFKYVSLALLALSALSAVHGLPLAARSTPPAGWIAGILEVSDSQRAIATYSHPLLSHMTPTTLVTLTSVASSSTTPRSSMIAVTP